jgi:SPOR domain
MADNSLRYRTNPVFPRSRPSSDDNAFDPGHDPGSDLINANSDDPLAELARLVGDVDPMEDRRTTAPGRDPWEAGDRSMPEPATHHLHAPPLADYGYSEESDAQQTYADGPGGTWQTNERGAYDQASHVEGVYYADEESAAQQQQYADDQYAEDQYADEHDGRDQYADGQYADEQYADDEYASYERQESPPARRGKLITVGLVLGLAVIGTAGAYAFRTVFSGGAPGTPPVIKADTSPTKIAAAPTDASSNKQIFDRLADRGQNERMVPREEQPLDVKSPAPQGQAAVAWPAPQGAPPPSAGQRPLTVTDPRPVRTVTISPTAPQAAPPAAPPAAGAPPVAARTPSPRAAAPQVDPNAPMALAPETPARLAPPAHTATHYVVQLSASNSREEAEASLRSAQSKYAELLGGRQPQVRERKSADKPTMYAAQIGGFTSRDDAVQVCQQLKSAGAKCFVP